MNWALYCRALFLQRSLLQPKMSVKSLADLDVQFLSDLGIKAIGLDKDNVLTFPDEPNMCDSVKEHFKELEKHFDLAVFSNSVGSNKDCAPNTFSRKIRNIPVVEHGTRKPHGGLILLQHFRTSNPSIKPQEIAFIGDRVLTDIIFANLNNFYPILIDPLDSKKDSKMIQMLRKLEKCFVVENN